MKDKKFKLPVWENIPKRLQVVLETLSVKIESNYCFETDEIRKYLNNVSWYNMPTLINNLIKALEAFNYPVNIENINWTGLPNNIEKLELLVDSFACGKRVFIEAPTKPVLTLLEVGDDFVSFSIDNIHNTTLLNTRVVQTSPYVNLYETYSPLKNGMIITVDNYNTDTYIKPNRPIQLSAIASNGGWGYPTRRAFSDNLISSTTGVENDKDAVRVNFHCEIEKDICTLTYLEKRISSYRLFFYTTIKNRPLPVVGDTLYTDVDFSKPYITKNGIKINCYHVSGGVNRKYLINSQGVVESIITC